jgi:DNA-binding response OmpR family regulator
MRPLPRRAALALRRLLRVSLGANGYKVFEATEGKQGLEEVAAHHPDLILLDLGLTDMDGMEVLTRLRELRSVPIIGLSVREKPLFARLYDSPAGESRNDPFQACPVGH